MQQQRMSFLARMMREVKVKGSTTQNRWWVNDCLVLIAKKAWLRPAWEDTTQQWYNWVHEKKNDEETKREEKSASSLLDELFPARNEEQAFLQRITNPAAWSSGKVGGRCQTLKEMRREDERVAESLAVGHLGAKRGRQAVEE